jgi:GNAT superfamily N-acetyltransferase
MLRPAAPADLTRLLAIRERSGADALSDPALVDEDELARLIADGAVRVWDEAGAPVGFAVVDGAIIHLLVASAARSKGVGRTLLAYACNCVKEAGHAAATVSLAAGSTAAPHYRAAGWVEAGRSATGGLVLKKRL